MGRTAKKSDLDLVLDKIDLDIQALQSLKTRLIDARADTQRAAMTAAPERKSHKRKPRAEAAPATGI